MKITQDQFQNIVNRYLDWVRDGMAPEIETELAVLKERYLGALLAALEYLEKNTRDDVLNLAAMGASSSETFSEQKELFSHLCAFLDATMIEGKAGAKTFSEGVAGGAKAIILNPHLQISSGMYVYDAGRNLGIREKYARNELSATHWLTDLDIERMMELTGTRSKISIMPLTTESIGAALHFARIQHADASEPYTLPFMINKGSEGGSSGNHWIAAKIMVDPLARTVSYQIDDSLALSSSQIDDYKSRIKSSIGFDDGFHKAFSSGDGWTVNDGEPSHVIGHAAQTDGYSCGYRAFQFLLQDAAIRGSNDNAGNYAKLNSSDSWRLVKGFYSLQLDQAFQISKEAFYALNSRGRSHFVKPVVTDALHVKADTPKVSKFLEVLESSAPINVTSDSVLDINPVVTDCVGAYQPGIEMMRFPETKTKGIGAAEYESLFEELAANETLLRNPLPLLSLPFCDDAAIDGLNAYFAVSKINLFEKIEIKLDLAEEDTADEMVAKLKMALSNLSRAGVETIVFQDANGVLKQNHIEALVEHVRSKSITVAIDLPQLYHQKSLQSTLDALVESNRRNQRAEALQGKLASEEALAKVNKTRPIRARERINMREALKVDIELQEGIEEAVQFQKVEKAPLGKAMGDVTDILRLDDISSAVAKNDFSQFSGVTNGYSKPDFVAVWHKLFGNITHGEFTLGEAAPGYAVQKQLGESMTKIGRQTVGINKDFNGITKAALAVLIKFNPVFADGINIRQLPQGFVVVSDPDNVGKRVLHYDSSVDPHDTIAPMLMAQEPLGVISIGTASRLIGADKGGALAKLWSDIHSGEEYSRTKSQAFRRYLPEILAMSDTQRMALIGLCVEGDDARFDPLRLNVIFSDLEKARNAFKLSDHSNSAKTMTTDIVAQMADAQWLMDDFPTEEGRLQFLALANPDEMETVANADLLLSLLDDEGLVASLQDIIKHYALKRSEVSALLRIHDKYGKPGIEKLIFAFKEIDAIANINLKDFPSIVNNPNAYESLINSPEILEQIKIISAFPADKRQWWNRLYEAHQPKVDNLPFLVKSFVAFGNKVQELGIAEPFGKLPDSDHLFTGAGNLPTTLGRMLTIIQLAHPQDKQDQWRAISQIDLSAEGAIRAMTDGLGSDRSCGFVIPEMAIDPFLNVSSDSYDTSKDFHSLGTAHAQMRAQLFFGYIAHQKYRMPVSFYRQAISDLENARKSKKLPDEAVNNLYGLLLASTTGDNFKFFVEPQKAMEQWRAVVNNIQSISINLPKMTDKAKSQTTMELMQLDSLPALPVLTDLVALLTTPLHGVGLTNMSSTKTTMERFANSNYYLRYCVQKYDDKIYQGMKFYQSSDFKNTFNYLPSEEAVRECFSDTPRDIFEEHLVVGLALHHLGVANTLMPLISTFRLNADSSSLINANALAAKIKNFELGRAGPCNKALVGYALTCFLEMDNNDGLSPQRLSDFLDALTSGNNLLHSEYQKLTARKNELLKKIEAGTNNQAEMREFGRLNTTLQYAGAGIAFESYQTDAVVGFSKKAIHDLVQEHFEENFSAGHFEALNAEKSSAKVSVVLEGLESFKNRQLLDEFQSIRQRFSAEADEDIIKLMVSLDNILRNEPSLDDKLQIIQKLSSSLVKESSFNDFYALLVSIEEYGSTGFLFLYDAASGFDRPIEHFAKKAQSFSTSALPNFRSEERTLTEVEAIDLIAELLIGAKDGELEKADYQLFQLQLEAYGEFSNTINAKGVKPDDIEVAVAALIKVLPELSQDSTFQKLSAHLSDLKVIEMEEYEVSPATTKEVALQSTGSGVSRFFGAILRQNWGYETVDVPAVMGQRPVKKNLDSELLDGVSHYIEVKTGKAQTYDFAFNRVISSMEALVTSYPAAKSNILPLMKKLLSYNDGSNTHAFQVTVAKGNIDLVKEEFEALNDQNLVIGLCEHFNGGDARFKFTDLLAIFKSGQLENGLNFANYSTLSAGDKKQLLTTVTSLLNNEKVCSLEDIHRLIEGSAHEESGAAFLQSLHSAYTKAPYPNLSDFRKWFDAVDENKAEYVQEQYNQWTKKPVFRESGDYDLIDGQPVFVEGVNGFRMHEARKAVDGMEGIKYTKKELQGIAAEVSKVRDLTMDELLAEIGEIKNNHDRHRENPTAMVALMAELLYRTKGQDGKGVGSDHEWGRSFEINTTQYLALHSMFKPGGHVTCQIGTGEGKSRISMLAIACQFALGNTVDFVTADVSLATRDYLKFQPFFNALGANTTLIKSDTPAEEYCKQGINFSDASNLSLFRNKARSEGKGGVVVDDEASKRALMLDEADATYYDTADTRFNYSAQADPAIRDMPWIYELLVEFFMEEANLDLYSGPHSDADRCNEAFYNFAKGKLNEEDMARLVFNRDKPMPVVSRNQLEAWQGSALTALALRTNIDYVIRGDVTIQTKGGARKVSQAQLLSGSRASEGAKFSFGVHQCLHARLNLEKRRAQAKQEGGESHFTPKEQELLGLKSSFYIDSENQIVYSTTSKALLDDYETGELLAVTGTAGAIKERQEAAALYGKSSDKMQFIDVPRHRGLKRKDLDYSLAKNPEIYHRKILEAVKASIARSQPVLLVCASDEKSQALYEFLNGSGGLTTTEKARLERISAKISVKDEEHYVENQAGRPGAITVTTAMLGRGTDIKLHETAKTHGLSVIGTYLPRQRDFEQIIGRAGRFGAPGMSQFILEEGEVKTILGIERSEIMPKEFYYATDSFLKHLKNKKDTSAQKQRVINDVVSDFRLVLTKQYFNDFYGKVSNEDNRDALLGPWRKFFDKTDKEWNEIRPQIVRELAQTSVDQDAIMSLLQNYEKTVSEHWDSMQDLLKAQVAAGKLDIAGGVTAVEQHLAKGVEAIQLSQKAQTLLNTTLEAVTHRTPRADSWQPGHVGRAVIYSSWGAGFKAFFKNIASAWKGESTWFPNLKAWWNGNMSVTELMFGSWGSPVGDRSNPEPPAGQTVTQDINDESREVETNVDQNNSNSTKKMMTALGCNHEGEDTAKAEVTSTPKEKKEKIPNKNAVTDTAQSDPEDKGVKDKEDSESPATMSFGKS